MKTSATRPGKLILVIRLCSLALVPANILFHPEVHAQVRVDSVSVRSRDQDADFPARGQFNAGLMSTFTGIAPPPALVGDVTYGVSSRIAAGILGGTTGAQSLAGAKLNAVLWERDNVRLMYRMIVIFYPGRDGQYLFDRSDTFIMPWMLSMGVADGSYTTSKGIRWSLGGGLLETHCVEGMKKYLWGTSEEEKVLPFEVFHTLQASASIPVSKRLILRPEVIAIMRHAKLIHKGEFKVFPINPFIKVVYSF